MLTAGKAAECREKLALRKGSGKFFISSFLSILVRNSGGNCEGKKQKDGFYRVNLRMNSCGKPRLREGKARASSYSTPNALSQTAGGSGGLR